MEHITEQLKGLGLSDYEALVYGTILVNSPASASYIAKKCSLSRSSVCTTLNTLIAKGLIGTTYKNSVRQFVIEDQNALEQLLVKEKVALDKKFALIESLKETALFFGRGDGSLPQVVFFEGQEGLQKIYLSMMRQAPKDSARYLLRDEFIWLPGWEFIFEHEWSDMVKRFAREKNMSTKLLVNASKLERSKISFYKTQKAFQYRFLPASHKISQFALYIIGDRVAILSMEKHNLVGIEISNKHLAENFKSTFETLWKASTTS